MDSWRWCVPQPESQDVAEGEVFKETLVGIEDPDTVHRGMRSKALEKSKAKPVMLSSLSLAPSESTAVLQMPSYVPLAEMRE